MELGSITKYRPARLIMLIKIIEREKKSFLFSSDCKRSCVKSHDKYPFLIVNPKKFCTNIIFHIVITQLGSSSVETA